MTHPTKPISPLRRQRMIDDMTLRKLIPVPQQNYIRSVMRLTRFLGRSAATAEDVMKVHFCFRKIGNGVVNDVRVVGFPLGLAAYLCFRAYPVTHTLCGARSRQRSENSIRILPRLPCPSW